MCRCQRTTMQTLFLSELSTFTSQLAKSRCSSFQNSQPVISALKGLTPPLLPPCLHIASITHQSSLSHLPLQAFVAGESVRVKQVCVVCLGRGTWLPARVHTNLKYILHRHFLLVLLHSTVLHSISTRSFPSFPSIPPGLVHRIRHPSLEPHHLPS